MTNSLRQSWVLFLNDSAFWTNRWVNDSRLVKSVMFLVPGRIWFLNELFSKYLLWWKISFEVRGVQQDLVQCDHICKCCGLFCVFIFLIFILMYLLVHNLTQLQFLTELIFLSNSFLISYNVNNVFTVVTAYKSAVGLQDNLRLNEICIGVLWNGKEKEGMNAQYGTNKPAQKIT